MLVVVVKTFMCNCVLAFEVTIHVHELPYLEDFVVLPPFHNISHFSKLLPIALAIAAAGERLY
jgi:hypothetical protein